MLSARLLLHWLPYAVDGGYEDVCAPTNQIQLHRDASVIYRVWVIARAK